MDNRFLCLKKIADSILEKTDFRPEVAVILGSGLGGLADQVSIEKIIEYSEIEEFPVPTVEGHAGKMIFGILDGVKVVLFSGRIHYYECASMERAVSITRIIKLLGINKLILTNAAGGIADDLEPGDIMAITDHISTFVPSPLIGPNMDELGSRFPDMTNVYDLEVVEKVTRAVAEKGVFLKRGVYVQTTGPNYETPAEVRMFKNLGGDAVGMSTACEAMVAKHMGMKVVGFSCITNKAAGLSGKKLSHQEVKEIANESKASGRFEICVREAIKLM